MVADSDTKHAYHLPPCACRGHASAEPETILDLLNDEYEEDQYGQVDEEEAPPAATEPQVKSSAAALINALGSASRMRQPCSSAGSTC